LRKRGRRLVVASRWLVKQETPPPTGASLRQFCSSVSYGPLGGFLPPLATKLTQSPWFLNTP
jgi:hypothetical protein